MKVRKMTVSAVLAAMALTVFAIEAQIPPVVPIPGVKLGLANIFTVFSLYFLGPVYAGLILTVRIVLGSLLLGQVSAMIYSLAGGILAYGISVMLSRIINGDKMWVVSVFAAVFHNAGQMAAAVLITQTPSLMWYMPALAVSGIITGAFTGVCAQLVYRRCSEITLSNKYQKDSKK